MIGADANVLQALEAVKSHDFDSTVCLESLGSVRKHFSIPSEYVLRASGSGQRSYHPCPRGFSISIDTLEAGLRFPLHPVIGERSPSRKPGECQMFLGNDGEETLSVRKRKTDANPLIKTIEPQQGERARRRLKRTSCPKAEAQVSEGAMQRPCWDGKVTLLHQELHDLKEGGNPDAVAAIEVRVAEAQSLAEHLQVELDVPMADEQPFDDSLPPPEE
ncbi:hypothetical protein BHE74_00054347 [Ensete ventricosum]|nr:hypothetical protein BHE74_00054347 [Ensete ventricosum]